jgi:hypothetical protein
MTRPSASWPRRLKALRFFAATTPTLLPQFFLALQEASPLGASVHRSLGGVGRGCLGRPDRHRTPPSGGAPEIVKTGFAEPSPAVFKAVLHRRGEIPSAQVRLPFIPASRESTDAAVGRAGHDEQQGRLYAPERTRTSTR